MNWNDIVERLGPRLYRYFLAHFAEPIAEDLTQETLLRVVRKSQRAEIDWQKGSLEMFSFGVAKNVRWEHLKNQNKHQADDIQNIDVKDTNASVLDQMSDLEQMQTLRRALNKLSEIQREILTLSIDEELGITSIAQIMEMPEGTVKSHIYRAKQDLISIMNKENL